MIPPRDFESAVSIKLLNSERGNSTFSAIFERDPHFLHWNRISLIGSDDDYARFLPISRGHVEWELYDNPSYGRSAGGDVERRTFGTATLNRSGRSEGYSIAQDGVQKFAQLSIRRHVEQVSFTNDRLSAVFGFLQRPPTWYAFPSRFTQSMDVRGKWRRVPSLGLKLRLLTTQHRRKDPRISQEIESIEIPGVEIQPIADMQDDVFAKAAQDLWFNIRVLLMYRFQQSITPLSEQILLPRQITTIWHRAEVEPRREASAFQGTDFVAPTDRFLARAAKKLATCCDQKGLLHAAAWGYASSFGTSILDAQLTDRVEAIERLVTIYEKTAGLDRARVSSKRWKPIKTALKQVIDDTDIDEELANQLKRSFASAPSLSLQERIERMAGIYADRWDQEDRDALSGLAGMITARNAIVHGRLVEDANQLALETVRSRLIFEKLFMSFLNCDNLQTSGYTHLSLFSLAQRVAGHEFE